MAHATHIGHRAPPRRASPHRAHRGPARSLWLIAVLAVIAVAYVVHVVWDRWPGYALAPDAPSVPITVAGAVFNVPPPAIRMAVQRRAGAQERIDLAFLWPSLTPPDPAVKPAPSDEPRPIDRLFITIATHGNTKTPTEMMQTIYPRYLAAEQSAGPGGLVGVPFREGTPYQGEDLFYDPANIDGFLARCSRSGQARTPGQCFYERQVGAADIIVRFPRDWLGDWQNLVRGVDRLLAMMRAGR